MFLLFALLLVSTASQTQAADSMWTAQYWNNKTLSGDPILQRLETEVNYDWGNGSPAPGVVGSDNFSVFWKRAIYFPGGNYRFTATIDDGMRVWVDGVLIIDSWWDSQVHSMSNVIYLSTGDHAIEVRYYESGGQAVARVTWTAVGGSGSPAPIVNWKGEYFNNMSLSGSPALVRDDAHINFDWGVGSPAPGHIGADNFSVRWTRTLWLNPGRYRFTVIADDGVRLWVNGQLVVDKWLDSYEGTYFAEVDIPGSTAIQMEYYENIGGAVARLDWVRLGGSGAYNWRGEYYNNKSLSGSPVLVRDDANINFNWGNGSPAPGKVNADNFSVRWSQSLYLNAGRYRFTVTADDGARLWVNNQQIINAWNDHQPTSYFGEIDLPGGSVPIRLEYYENGGGAMVSLSWNQISNLPPQPTPVPTPVPTYGTGVVQSPLLNVRYGPGLQYGVITQLVKGQTVTLAGYRSTDSHWVMINWDGSTAWVSGLASYLWTSIPVSSLTVWTGTVSGTGGPTGVTGQVVNCNYLNVRTGPGVTYSVIKAVPSGTIVSLLGRNSASSWAYVRLLDGTTGWMSVTYLNPSVPLNTLPVVS